MPNGEKSNLGRDLLSLGAGAIPVVGSMISAGMQRRWAVQDAKAQQAYDSPVEQLKRLREAGLSEGMLYDSRAAGQSASPRASNVDPTLGTAQGLEKYNQSRLQRAQLQLLTAQTRTEQALGEKTWADALTAKANSEERNAEVQYKLTQSDYKRPPEETTNLVTTLETKMKSEIADKIAKNINNDIQQLNLNVTEGNLREQVRKMVNENTLLEQSINSQQNKLAIENKLMEGLMKDGLDIGEAFIHSILMGNIKAPIK